MPQSAQHTQKQSRHSPATQHDIGRLLLTAENRIAESVKHCTYLLTFSKPTSLDTHAQLTPSPPTLPSDPLTQEPRCIRLSAFKRLESNQSPGVRNILREMLKYGGDEVHQAMHCLILGIWCTQAAPNDLKHDTLIPIPKRVTALCAPMKLFALQRIAAKAYANVRRARLSAHLKASSLTSKVASDYTDDVLSFSVQPPPSQ